MSKYVEHFNLNYKSLKVDSLKLNLLIIVLFWIPFVNIFGKLGLVYPNFGLISLARILNFLSFFISIILLYLIRRIYSKLVLIYSIAILILLISNYILTQFASTKWLLNWCGFIFIFFTIANTVLRLTDKECYILSNRFGSSLVLGMSFLALIVVIAWFFRINDLIHFFIKGQHNNSLALLSYSIGIEKQELGNIMVMFFAAFISYWRSFNVHKRLLLLFCLIMLFPAYIGIRTMILSLSMTFIWIIILGRSNIRMMALSLSPIVCIIIFIYWENIYNYLVNNFDRLPSIKFSWFTFRDTVFGLGNGGYHVYINENMIKVLSRFGSETMKLKGQFWLAPESDLAYFIASWGLLAVPFFVFFSWFIFKARKIILYKGKNLSLDKTILVFETALIFSSLSQDNAGKLLWWIYLGAAVGIILRKRSVMMDFSDLMTKHSNGVRSCLSFLAL